MTEKEIEFELKIIRQAILFLSNLYEKAEWNGANEKIIEILTQKYENPKR